MDLSGYSSLGEMLFHALSKNTDSPALIEADRDRESAVYTYGDMRRVVSTLTHALESRVSPGGHVAILMSNQSKWLLCASAIFWRGGVLVPLDYKLTPAEQIDLLTHSEAKVLFIEFPVYFRILREKYSFPPDVRIIVTEAPSKEKIAHERFEDLLSKAEAPEVTVAKKSRDDVACIVYSSGTGGTPKGCMLTHGNYLSQAQVLGTMFPIKPEDRYFSVLPTNHAIDFMCGFLLPLQFGSAIVHQRTLRPEYLATTMKKYGISHMALVPLLLKAFERKIKSELDAQPEWKRALVNAMMKVNRVVTARRPCHAFSKRLFAPIHEAFGGKLKLLFAGGAFVDASMAEFFYSIGLPVVIGYGLTEAGTVLTVNDLRPFRSDTVGKAIEGTTVELRDLNDQRIGEVWVQGPTIMKGYFKEPQLTEDAIVHGWLKTGDLGTVESSGHVKLLGRSKNMIVTEGGKNIYPEDVEASFESLDSAAEVCVFSSSYLWRGTSLTKEKLLMVVHAKDATEQSQVIAEIKERNHRLADYKRIDAILFWNKDFPRTASMKIKRNVLAEELKMQDANSIVEV